MQAVVTGCAGFIGSHLTDSLLADGHEVVGVDCLIANYPREQKLRNLAAARGSRRFRLATADLAEADLDPLLEGCDVVFHLAGEPGVRQSFGERYETYLRNNVLATERLLDAAARRPGVRVVYASSSSVYGEAARRPTPEDAAPAPVSPYGLTKLAGEDACRAHGDRAVILRYFSVFGPRQRPDMAFARFMAAALEGVACELHGDGRQERDFTYVGDVVAATRAAAVAPEAGGRVFNVGGGAAARLEDALAVVGELAGAPPPLRRTPVQPGDVRATGADIAAARAALGWAPATSLRDGLAAQWAWTAAQAALWDAAA